jgi:hypothetical protein
VQLPVEDRHVANHRDTVKVVREPYLAEKVVLVDGLPGCGKTMLSPIIGALPRAEIMQYAFTLEYVCALRYLGRIEDDAASVLIRMLTDLQLYNVMMGRETNFRPRDLSGVLRNSHRLRYFLRLVQSGDAAVIPRIKAERPLLHLTTHNVLQVSSPIFAALGPRALIVEVIRHPLYMIRQQALYMDRYGTDVRDFTIWFDYKGVPVPYFALGWEEVFLSSNAVEKSIYMTHYLTKRVEELTVAGDGSGNAGVLLVPFERYVIDPWPYMQKLEALLDTQMDSHTKKMMKKQNVPRGMYAQGIGLGIYKQNGWKPPEKGSDERRELEQRRQFAADHARPEAMEVLDRLCAEYENKYLRENNLP